MNPTPIYLLADLMAVRYDRTAPWDRQWVLTRRDREMARFATYTDARKFAATRKDIGL